MSETPSGPLFVTQMFQEHHRVLRETGARAPVDSLIAAIEVLYACMRDVEEGAFDRALILDRLDDALGSIADLHQFRSITLRSILMHLPPATRQWFRHFDREDESADQVTCFNRLQTLQTNIEEDNMDDAHIARELRRILEMMRGNFAHFLEEIRATEGLSPDLSAALGSTHQRFQGRLLTGPKDEK